MRKNPLWLGRLAFAYQALAFAALGCCAFGCADRADIPDLPSLEQLSQAYDTPTAELEPTDVRTEVDSVPELDRLLAGFRSTATVLQPVDEAKEPAEDRTGAGIRLRGALYITLRCPGQIDRPEYDNAKNGSVKLTLGVSQSRIRRTIAGEASQCRFDGKFGTLPISILLDGGIDLDVGSDIPLGQPLSDARWLVALQGSITIDDIRFSGISARISADKVETLLRLPDGTWVVLSASDSAFTVRSRDAVWSCNKSGGPCERN